LNPLEPPHQAAGDARLIKVRLTKPKLITELKKLVLTNSIWLEIAKENDFPNGITEPPESDLDIEGVMCDAPVGAQIGFVMGKKGAGVDVDLAAAGNSEVVKSKPWIMQQSGIKGGTEDIFIALAKTVSHHPAHDDPGGRVLFM
jgi:hypothetical protein